ncbi:MAG: DUF4143 domain-containing protein [Nocardiopsaceae bacterium]|nr:DUF4143 domain-containing protein [Nocardiopsaceae bacterium]
MGHPAFGNLAETFVFTELLKLRTVSEVPFTIYQFREREGREVDFVLEGRGGAVVGQDARGDDILRLLPPGTRVSPRSRSIWMSP